MVERRRHELTYIEKFADKKSAARTWLGENPTGRLC
jgi:hypothetical protein